MMTSFSCINVSLDLILRVSAATKVQQVQHSESTPDPEHGNRLHLSMTLLISQLYNYFRASENMQLCIKLVVIINSYY